MLIYIIIDLRRFVAMTGKTTNQDWLNKMSKEHSYMVVMSLWMDIALKYMPSLGLYDGRTQVWLKDCQEIRSQTSIMT